jgi:hypothetical protein
MKQTLIEQSYFKLRMNELGMRPADAAVACGSSVAAIDKWCRASAGLINHKTGRMHNLPNGDNTRRIELGLQVSDFRTLFPAHYPEHGGGYKSNKYPQAPEDARDWPGA